MTISNEEKIFHTKLGLAIRALRREKGVTQEDLAKLLNTTFQQIQKYEKGVNRISIMKLFAIAEYLKVPFKAFFDEYPNEHVQRGKLSIQLMADYRESCFKGQRALRNMASILAERNE